MKRYYITNEDYKIAANNGISKINLKNRVYNLGWKIEKAITLPVNSISKDNYIVKSDAVMNDRCKCNSFLAKVKGTNDLFKCRECNRKYILTGPRYCEINTMSFNALYRKRISE